ncbi:MAG: hypothetical protein OCD03_13305 [Hyphomicrobiales bacterium]
MIVYILKFTSESAAHATLALLGMSVARGGESYFKAPDQSNWFPISAVVTDAALDEDGAIITAQVVKDGYWLMLNANQPIAEIAALPELQHECDFTELGDHEEVASLSGIDHFDGAPSGIDCQHMLQH